MKKLLILNQNYFKYEIGGAEQQSYVLAKEFISYGYEVHYVFINSGDYAVPLLDEGIYLHPMKHMFRHKIYGKPFFLYKSKIFKILNKIKPDYIYHRGLSSFLGIAVKYKNKNKCKIFWHVASKWDVQKLNFLKFPNIISSMVNVFFIKYGIRNVDGIFVQEKDHILQLNLLYNISKNITLIDKFLEPIIYNQNNTKINKKIKKIIWVGNIKPVKQLELFLEIAEFYKKNKEYEFIVVGSLVKGKYQDKLRFKMEKLSNVCFKGVVPFEKVNKLIANSDALINTSLLEGGPPVTFIQAWLTKTTVFSLSVDPDKVFSKEKIGFCFNNDIENMKKNLDDIFMEQEKLDILKEKSYDYAIKKYSFKNIKKIKDIFEK